MRQPRDLGCDVAARGVDFPGVTWIVQYDTPGEERNYARGSLKCKKFLSGSSSRATRIRNLTHRNVWEGSFCVFQSILDAKGTECGNVRPKQPP